MLSRADLALYDRDGQLAVVAEVKNKLGTSGEWAAKLRRNILAHGGFRGAEFFLLATPDRLYLWKGAGLEPAVVPPTYEIDARSIFQPYLERTGTDSGAMSESAFELVVGAWLADLTRSEEPSKELAERQGWLIESGFLNAVRNGRVAYEVVM
jgi:hypothetical protein